MSSGERQQNRKYMSIERDNHIYTRQRCETGDNVLVFLAGVFVRGDRETAMEARIIVWSKIGDAVVQVQGRRR